MSDLWRRDPSGKWGAAKPSGFLNEQAIEDLIFAAPSMIPLAGQPGITPLLRQFPLSKGRVDIMAVEDGGRPVLIEVKLAKSSEARRAIIGQILAYAAHLEKMPLREFVGTVTHGLSQNASLADLVQGPMDPDDFDAAVGYFLDQGIFRLVLVLDSVPAELIRTVSYLHFATSQKVSIDVVELRAYDIGGEQVIVPELLLLSAEPPSLSPGVPNSPPLHEPTPELFLAAISSAKPEAQQVLTEWAHWAQSLEAERLARLSTGKGNANTVLTLRLPDNDNGLASLWNSNGSAQFRLHGKVLAKRAPAACSQLTGLMGDEALAGKSMHKLDPSEVTPAVLELVRSAYVEAAPAGLMTP